MEGSGGGGPGPREGGGFLPRGLSPLRVAAAAALLAAAVLAAFAGSLDNGFVNFDDDRYITANEHLSRLSADDLRWILTDTHQFYWHPLTYLVHAAELRLWGTDPAGHHATSLLLHAVNAALLLLLFLAAARAAGSAARPGALLAAGLAGALLFALHPLRVESVAWASEKKDLLAALFLFAGALAWLRYAGDPPGRRRRRWYAASLGALALGMASKPMPATMPAVLLLLDAWPLRRFGREPTGRLLAEMVPFAAVALLAVLPSLLDPRQEALLPAGTAAALATRGVTALRGAAFPLLQTLWPDPLLPFHPLPFADEISLASPRYLLPGLLLAGLTAAALLLRRRGWPAPAAAWGIYLVTVAPVCGLRQAGAVEAADRFSYLPTAALFLLAAAAGLEAVRRSGWPRAGTAALAAAGALAAGLGLLTARQVEVWRDSGTLWSRVLAAHPDRIPLAHNNLGSWYLRVALDGHRPELLARAEGEFRRSLRLKPDQAHPHNNLGLIHRERGEYDAAAREFREAVALEPDYSLAYANLAVTCLLRDRVGEAREAWSRALAAGREIPPRIREAVEEVLAAGGGAGPAGRGR